MLRSLVGSEMCIRDSSKTNAMAKCRILILEDGGLEVLAHHLESRRVSESSAELCEHAMMVISRLLMYDGIQMDMVDEVRNKAVGLGLVEAAVAAGRDCVKMFQENASPDLFRWFFGTVGSKKESQAMEHATALLCACLSLMSNLVMSPWRLDRLIQADGHTLIFSQVSKPCSRACREKAVWAMSNLLMNSSEPAKSMLAPQVILVCKEQLDPGFALPDNLEHTLGSKWGCAKAIELLCIVSDSSDQVSAGRCEAIWREGIVELLVDELVGYEGAEKYRGLRHDDRQVMLVLIMALARVGQGCSSARNQMLELGMSERTDRYLDTLDVFSELDGPKLAAEHLKRVLSACGDGG
eukprot:TRINITY_DN16944_c0_g1_i1.p1 TRINITY_DN16944_c0_g1~~TRINITY_DN16944_c0_g1_i1.p1  ORF type:complete len:353 (+),score=95.59 TRINITY_DN16944_c0_g1_i1:114-1172(+)